MNLALRSAGDLDFEGLVDAILGLVDGCSTGTLFVTCATGDRIRIGMNRGVIFGLSWNETRGIDAIDRIRVNDVFSTVWSNSIVVTMPDRLPPTSDLLRALLARELEFASEVRRIAPRHDLPEE